LSAELKDSGAPVYLDHTGHIVKLASDGSKEEEKHDKKDDDGKKERHHHSNSLAKDIDRAMQETSWHFDEGIFQSNFQSTDTHI